MKKLFLIIFSLLTLLSFTLNEYYSSASFYGDKHNGRKTASGEIFYNSNLTAAHKTFKFGTKLEVTNVANQKTVIVRVNDRGPFVKGRDLDLSKAAFKSIASISSGVVKIKYKIIE